MHRLATNVLLIALILPAASQAASGDCTKLRDVVESYLGSKHPTTPQHPFRVAVYDRNDRSWHAFRWDGTDARQEERSLEVPVSNEPTLYVRRGEEVAVLIANTNPLLYTSEVTSVTRADIAILADLQKIAALAGGILPGIPHVNRAIPNFDITEAIGALSETRVESFRRFEAASIKKYSDRDARKHIVSGENELVALVADFREALQPIYDPAKEAVQGASADVKTVKNLAIDVASERAAIAESLQFAELGRAEAIPQETLDSLAHLTAVTRKDFDRVSTSVAALRDIKTVCPASIGALDAVLRIVLDGTPDKDDQEAVDNELRAAFRKLRDSAVTNDCDPAENGESTPAPDHTNALTQAIIKLAAWLRVPENRAIVDGSSPATNALKDARKSTAAYLKVPTTRDAIVTAADELLQKRAAALRLAVEMERFDTLYSQQSIKSDCWMTAGVVEVQRIQKNDLDLPWFNVQTEEFNVTVRPQFKDDVLRALPDDVKGKYSFSRRNYGFGVDTALIVTHANDREYKAVARLVQQDVNKDNVIDEKDTRLFATETSRSDRTGKLALMLTASPPWLHGFGAQFGLGVDTDNPAGFIGVTRSIGHFARISLGHTQQRVTRLDHGLSVGSIVPTADDLKTRERFDASWYASLAFTISELPIFKTK